MLQKSFSSKLDGFAVRLAGLAGEYGVSVRFLGNVAHEKLPELYRGHDAFVLPSRNEGMSNTVLEAIASGRERLRPSIRGRRWRRSI